MIRPIAFAAVSVFALGLAAPADASPVQDPARGSVHIDFVRYDPAGTDTGANAHINKEIGVIKNGTSKARMLTGWTLRDTSGHVYRFPATRLRPGHSVTVHTGKGHNRPGQRYWGQGWYVWNNTGDTATLRTNSFKLIDRCKWGDGDGSTGC
jgi:Lamin Tail Domain